MLLKYRGDCIIAMNWGAYSENINYQDVIFKDWPAVADVLLRRLKQMEAEGISPNNLFMYGHSLGARLVISAGMKFGKGKIAQIDGKNFEAFFIFIFKSSLQIACDSAGPGFFIFDWTKNIKDAAQNLQCIHTSNVAGTNFRNCHQDWEMGKTTFS